MENWSLEQIRLNQLEIYNMVINRIQSLLGMNLGYYHDILQQTTDEEALYQATDALQNAEMYIEQTLDAVESYIEDGFFENQLLFVPYFWDVVRDLEYWMTDIPFYTRKYTLFFRANLPIVKDQIMNNLQR